ncbi:MAG: hypothetical protein MZW92_11330 [Comamonadaceae bacterium]|nr:hypothetical protein [Comamonadaceae bacterium]
MLMRGQPRPGAAGGGTRAVRASTSTSSSLRLGERLQVDWHVDDVPGGCAGAAADAAAAAGERRLSRHRAGRPAPARSRIAIGAATAIASRIDLANPCPPRGPPPRRQPHGAGQHPRAPDAASSIVEAQPATPASPTAQYRGAHPPALRGAQAATGMSEPLRVLIVDDEAPARSRLRDAAGGPAPATARSSVVGEAGNGAEALALARRAPARRRAGRHPHAAAWTASSWRSTWRACDSRRR